ncbi:hypothetical protein GE061_005088 [Apolygus lucorum]|uniref:Secreted protein n=1 Tax=Apolygus lucorum TaxID=248454 RepID=A0A8S9WZ69_APOLU|nr:hypothetical protein GE061_005088 [Apolygus lucorum]
MINMTSHLVLLTTIATLLYRPTSAGECKAALGMEEGRIPDTAISASSSYEIKSVGPQNARKTPTSAFLRVETPAVASLRPLTTLSTLHGDATPSPTRKAALRATSNQRVFSKLHFLLLSGSYKRIPEPVFLFPFPPLAGPSLFRGAEFTSPRRLGSEGAGGGGNLLPSSPLYVEADSLSPVYL